MSKNQLLDEGQLTPAIVAAVTGKSEGTTSKAQDLLIELLLGDLQEKKAEKKQAEDDRKRARESNIEDVKNQVNAKKFTQSNCPHKKPNGHPSIGGQRDHRQHYNWICLYCQKEWKDNALPLDLRISMDRVGGPNL
jgi:hypothetical protein